MEHRKAIFLTFITLLLVWSIGQSSTAQRAQASSIDAYSEAEQLVHGLSTITVPEILRPRTRLPLELRLTVTDELYTAIRSLANITRNIYTETANDTPPVNSAPGHQAAPDTTTNTSDVAFAVYLLAVPSYLIDPNVEFAAAGEDIALSGLDLSLQSPRIQRASSHTSITWRWDINLSRSEEIELIFFIYEARDIGHEDIRLPIARINRRVPANSYAMDHPGGLIIGGYIYTKLKITDMLFVAGRAISNITARFSGAFSIGGNIDLNPGVAPQEEQPNHKAGFFDHIFFWVILTGGFLCAVDWLMGARQRKAVKEKIGEWWLYVDEASFGKLGSSEAKFFRAIFLIALSGKPGNKIHALRSTTVVFIFLVVWYLLSALYQNFFEGVYVKNLYNINILLILMIFALPPVSFICALSLHLTAYLLHVMEKSQSLLNFSFLFLLDFIIAVLLSYGAYSLLSELIAVMPPALQRELRMEVMAIGRSGALGFFSDMVVLVCLLPTILHAASVVVFMVSKIAQPVLRPIISLLLLRFHESDKGALTQLAVIGGAAVKLGQEAIKYFSGL